MTPAAPARDVSRLLIVLPNWVGDVVMASPVLAALRSHFQDTEITFLMRPYVREIVEGCGWNDQAISRLPGVACERCRRCATSFDVSRNAASTARCC
jgi:ADP-heptose:LPS heptosyltransferase